MKLKRAFGLFTALGLSTPLLASADEVACRVGMNQKPVLMEKSPAGFFQIAIDDPNFKKIDVIVDPRMEEQRTRVYLHDFETNATLNVWTHGIGKDQIVELSLPGAHKDFWLECDFGQAAAPLRAGLGRPR